jgi:carboxylesterase
MASPMHSEMQMVWDFSIVLARRLLLWSALSIATGVALMALYPPWRETFGGGFGLQAVLWGAIDAGIAGFGIANTRKSINAAAGQDRAAVAAAARRDAERLKRLLWINTGLDVLYVAGGLTWALTRGATDPFAAGTGWGIVLQGAFLFLFDLLHARAVPLDETADFDLDLFRDEEHQPFAWEGGAAAAVLVHGFGGTPAEMRALGRELNAAGWTVQGILLPGFGEDIATLPRRSHEEWREAVQRAATELRSTGHGPLLLVGYSMGSAAALAATPQVQPDGLALVAPFWWQERAWLRIVGGALRPFLPSSFRPLSRANFGDPRIQQGLSKFLPGADLTDPQVQAALRQLRFPLRLVEQVRDLSAAALAAAAGVTAPVLLVQGATDPVVRVPATRRLAERFPAEVGYVEVAGAHDLTLPDSPAWPAVSAAVLAFAESVRASKGEV